jgi:prepilin-type N-terminal cleavage/methylation domain-containing protein/prepilin-type processing-associated H-X9-DG protein
MRPLSHRSSKGFSLIELIVVIGIIAILIAILLPTLSKALTMNRRLLCLANQRQIGQAIHNYADENRGCIPYGPPTAPPFTTTNFYPVPGTVTSLISLQSGAPVGLGLMLGNQLANCKKILFCPDADQDSLADQQLANVGIGQAQCDYYYRDASGGSMFVNPGASHLKLAALGLNSQGRPIRALTIDVDYLCYSGLSVFGVYTRTNHHQQTVNVLYSDGHAEAFDNRSGTFTVDARTNLNDSFAKILAVFETADAQ